MLPRLGFTGFIYAPRHIMATPCYCFCINLLEIGVIMKFSCRDYGFDCDFEIEGKQPEAIISNFGQHTNEEHGIEYSKEALMQFILRKR